MPRRPQGKEIWKKVADACAAIAAGRRQIGLSEHLSADLEEMRLENEKFLWELLPVLLREIQASDPVACYRGDHPPLKSNAQSILGEELWEYAWPSCHCGCDRYLKFAMKKNSRGEWVYIHARLHVDRP
jgi:hypothetical protein